MALHILIVDTDVHAAQATSAVVSRPSLDVTVQIAPTHELALRSMQEQCPDVLIIDPSPHDLDGAGLIRHFKAAYPGALTIVVASAPTPALRRRMDELKVDRYLEKPALLSMLWRDLQALLASSAETPPNEPTPSAQHV
ncbi:MAG TPA: response regulator [Roseiflexaceae bacterium]|nr:response regulator [Roseiflexaceae bacterium]